MECRQVCQIRARHGSHPELHTTRQVSDVMGMTAGSASALLSTLVLAWLGRLSDTPRSASSRYRLARLRADMTYLNAGTTI